MDAIFRAALLHCIEGDVAPLLRALNFRLRRAAQVRGPCVRGHRASVAAVWFSAETLRAALDAARQHASRAPLRQHLYIARIGGEVLLLTFGLDGTARHARVNVRAPLASDLEMLSELAGARADSATGLTVLFARALDRSRVTGRFFDDLRMQRAAIADAWIGVPRAARRDRAQLALVLLCRLLFLYFLQRDGILGGDPAYMRALIERARGHGQSPRRRIYSRMLLPLFRGVLNRRPEQRTARARAFGDLPYLNGGLFDLHTLERRHRRADLPDDCILALFDDLLDRYRFASRDHATAVVHEEEESAIDPEMLGRVFEGLMAGADRVRTATYYTPPALVDAIVRDTIDAYRAVPGNRLERVRVLDPACGSGAFLLGALERVAQERARGGEPLLTVRRSIVAGGLYGLDLQDDAALLCALRLWLALATGEGAAGRVDPLPNLDRRIRQGDALVDPLAADGVFNADAPAGVRALVARLRSHAARYLAAAPEEKRVIARAIRGDERALADQWLERRNAQLRRNARELAARATARDLFGVIDGTAHAAAAELRELEEERKQNARLRRAFRQRGSLPFFSFPVHFAEAAVDGFDLVLSNPPWLRAHDWPQQATQALRSRYEVCRGGGGQVDLSLLFLEQSIRLLRKHGALGMLVPAKALRSAYGARARDLLLRTCDVTHVRDLSLDPNAHFQVDAYPAAIVARRTAVRTVARVAEASAPYAADEVRITLARTGLPSIDFTTPRSELSLDRASSLSPWLLCPPDVRTAIRTMQSAGSALGDRFPIRRGVLTGANDVFVLDSVKPRLGELAEVVAAGARRSAEPQTFHALVEERFIRPLLRGADVHDWQFAPTAHLIWLYDDALRLQRAPRHLARYLERHAGTLRQRSAAARLPLGSLFRLSPELLRPKVVWRDIAETLTAAVVADARTVPLNTIYFVAPPDVPTAHALTGLLNSLPLRVFARTIAERAKNGFFRFFANTVAVLPVPAHGAVWSEISRLSEQIAHASGSNEALRSELDGMVAGAFGLSAADLNALRTFDAWLSGVRL